MTLTAERQRWYRHQKALAVYQYLTEHPCVDCGEADPIVLEFDHVRGEKRHGVKRMLAGTYSLKAVMEEIAKCEVRCANCHRRITALRGDFYRYLVDPAPEPSRQSAEESKCGTRTGYRRGCRCEDCKTAQRVYQRDWARRKRDLGSAA